MPSQLNNMSDDKEPVTVRDAVRGEVRGDSITTRTVYFGLALLMGLGGGFGAQFFIAFVGWLSGILSGLGGALPTGEATGYEIGFIGRAAVLKLGAMLFGASLLVMIILFLSGLKKFDGPADTIEAARRPNAQVDVKEGLLATLIAAISMGGGAPVGQYGPLVHFGATLAAIVAKIGKLPRAASETLLACGVAGAISAAFGAPLAGILFAHEAILRHFSLRAFAPVTVAAAMSYAVVQNFFPTPLFLPSINVQVTEFAQVFMLIIIGLGGGVIASLFMAFCLKTERATPNLPVPFWTLPLGASALLLLAGMFVPQILGGRPDVIIAAINGDIILFSLVVFCLLKLLMAGLSIAFGLYGGVFAPALFIGVMFGASFGQLGVASGMIDASAVGLFALAGMGAVISSTVGAPLATILIVLELTSDYGATTGVMISVVFANIVSTRLFGRSLFDGKLRARGVNMALSRNDFKLSHAKIGALVAPDYCRLLASDNTEAKIAALIAAKSSEGYVVDGAGYLVAKHDIISLHGGEIKPYDVLTENMSVLDVMTRLSNFESGFVGESLPITDEQGKMLGIVTEGAIFGYYQTTSAQSHAEENG